MQTKEFYEALFQFGADWRVSKVETDHSKLEVEVYLEYALPQGRSPSTGDLLPFYDHRPERRWRHLDTMQYKTFLHARIPRIREANGDIVSISVPWSDAHSHHSWLFESWAIQLLEATRNQTQTSALLRISYDQLHLIMERAVERGLMAREREFEQELPDGKGAITTLAIDEKSYRVGPRFLTIVSDHACGRVLEIAEGRSEEAAISAMQSALPPKALKKIVAVSMDMAPGFRQAVEKLLPHAEIVHDKFHLFQYLSNAIDQTRRAEVIDVPLLRNARFAMLKNEKKRTEKQRQTFHIIDELNLKTAQAWRVRENFKGMYETCATVSEAIAYYALWKGRALATAITPVRHVVETFDRHVAGIVMFFKHKITSALAERLNGKIQTLKVIGRGYRNVENLRIAILFFYGKLDLLPHRTL
jgi:transposase